MTIELIKPGREKKELEPMKSFRKKKENAKSKINP